MRAPKAIGVRPWRPREAHLSKVAGRAVFGSYRLCAGSSVFSPLGFFSELVKPCVRLPAVGSLVLDEATCPCRLGICYHRPEAVSLVSGRSALYAQQCSFRSWSGSGPPLVESMSGAPSRSYVRMQRPVQIGALPSIRTAASRHHLGSGRKCHVRPPVSGYGAGTGTRCGYPQEDIGRSNRSSRCRTTSQQVSGRHGMSRIAHREVLP